LIVEGENMKTKLRKWTTSRQADEISKRKFEEDVSAKADTSYKETDKFPKIEW